MARLLIILEGAMIFAGMAVFQGIFGSPLAGGANTIAAIVAQAGGLAISVLTAFYLADLYSARILRSFQALLRRLPRAGAAVGLAIAVFTTLVPHAQVVENVLQSSVLATIAIMFGLLLPIRALAARIARSRRFAKRLLIVGAGSLASRLIAEIEYTGSRYVVAAVADEEPAGNDYARTSSPFIVGSAAGLDSIIEQTRPDRIVVALGGSPGRGSTQRLLKARVHQGLPIDDAAQLYERLTGKVAIEALAPSQVIFGEGFDQFRLSLVVRRAVSIAVAFLGLAVTAPLFGLIALAIRLDSRGPVLFAQRRIGFRGKPFTLLKFRTMHPVAWVPSEWARDNGQRITRVGRWLRRFWLDELPQLVNVLRGDMDLVGPRPHPVSNFELFVLVSRNTPECGEPIPYYALRCMVRPGLTGWAQVRYGYANDLNEEIEKMRYDLYYIKHRSVWLDLRILLETLKIILSPRDVDAAYAADIDAPAFSSLPAPDPIAGNGAAPAGVRRWGSREASALNHEVGGR